jgi:hypothetical protein
VNIRSASFAASMLLCATAFSTAPAMAATSTTQTTILNPLSVVGTDDLDFGTLIPGTTAGTATINPTTGARTVTGGTVAAGGAPMAATFQTAGFINRIFIIGAPPATVTLTNGTGGSMVMDSLTFDGPMLRIFPSNAGVTTVKLGARLNVGANQASGNYTGTYSVTIVYL